MTWVAASWRDKNRDKSVLSQKNSADALWEMEVKDDGYGKKVLFSLEFYTKKGEVVYFSHACLRGHHGNMKKNRMRNVQQCDSAGNNIGSPVAVSIDNLRMLNGKKVLL